MSKDRKIFQHRNDAHDDHDHAHDLLGLAVDWQHVDEIENQNDDDECYENSDKSIHAQAPLWLMVELGARFNQIEGVE
jgi:hypothetical protein